MDNEQQMTLNDILHGDVILKLLELPDGFFNTIVTSPPYYALRDYGIPKSEWPEVTWQLFGITITTPAMTCCLGLEPTPNDFIAHLVYIFRLAKRTLRDDGTLWINIGDSYWGGKGKSGQSYSPEYQNERYNAGRSFNGAHHQIAGRKQTRPTDEKHPYIKPKDMIGIPWMLAFALREDGWVLRQDTIWSKPNPMPESVEDRCTKSHEYIFLLSKDNGNKKILWRHKTTRKWRYDEPLKSDADRKKWMGFTYYFDQDAIKEAAVGTEDANGFRGGAYVHDETYHNAAGGKRKKSGNIRRKNGSERGCPEGSASNVCSSVAWEGNTRNKRSVWTVAVKAFAEAHFATFPEELIVDCIKAGCPVDGCVLDIFIGSGTTGTVSRKLNRNFKGIDLSEVYINTIANPRLVRELGLFH